MSCSGCSHPLESTAPIFSTKSEALEFLERHGCLLARNGHSCPRCGSPLRFHEHTHLWRCSGHICDRVKRKHLRCFFRTSRHKGTWLDRTKISPEVLLRFVLAFFHDALSVEFAKESLQMSRRAYSDWCNFVREVCRVEVEASQTPIGGAGIAVEVGETMIGKRKWIIGGVERGSKRMFLEIILNRGPETLQRIIRSNVATGSTIITKVWSGYLWLKDDPSYNYQFVNLSVDSDAAAHLRNIVRELKNVKASIGPRKEHLHSYLATFIWKRLHPDREMRLHHFHEAVSRVYTPKPPSLP